MKQLTIIRHAKSSWKYPTKDFYRPLNQRGIRQAPLMAKYFKKIPDLVIASPAVRAYSTAISYFLENRWDISMLRLMPELFDAEMAALVSAIEAIEDDVHHLMLIAHNPSLNLFANFLNNDFDDNIVTAACLTWELDISYWRDLSENCGHLVEYVIPSELE